MSARYADKAILKRLNAAAIDLNYNRTLDPAFIDRQSEDELFALSPMLIHEHAHGVRVDPHMRCRLLARSGGPGFEFVLLDVPFYLYELLPEKQALQTANN